MADLVNHPAHYTSGPTHTVCGEPIECIDVTETLGFNLGNAIKYVWRAEHKGSQVQDLRKAVWYLQRELDRLNKAEQMPKVESDDDCSGCAMCRQTVRWSEPEPPFLTGTCD